MRKAIIEYLELSNIEKKELWNNAVFVFDTNVYLNLYRYSKRTSDKLIIAMESYKERTWMPHRVAQEFMKNRVKIIFETIQNYERLLNSANNFVDECQKILNMKTIDDDTNIKELQGYLSKWIDNYKKDNLVVSELSNDKILERILDLYEGKVGKAFNASELQELYKEGESRYKEKIPPGYKDVDKLNKDEKYGDLIVWKQILNYARNEKKNIVFVTNDVKEDWWEIINGKKLGPRVELKKEFYDQTSMKFYMYNDVQFITMFQENKSEPVDKSVVNEMETVNEYTGTLKSVKEQYYREFLYNDRMSELENQMRKLERLIEENDARLHKIRITNEKRRNKLNIIENKIEELKLRNQAIPINIIDERTNTKKRYIIDIANEEHLMDQIKELRHELDTAEKDYEMLMSGKPYYMSFDL